MESVKKERVSPLLAESVGSTDPSPRPPSLPEKSAPKVFHSHAPTSVTAAAAAAAAVAGASLVVNEDGTHAVLVPRKTHTFSGEISDAVSKILEDYDWSKIPLANKDGCGPSERRKVHVKRPMNAFMVWAQEARRKLSCSHRQVHNAELSKSLGKIWRGMTEDQKRPFIERADHLRRKHKQEYPDYKYQPRRRKENVKTVGNKPSSCGPPPSCTGPLSVHDLAQSHQFVSGSVKGEGLALGLHPLSPPHSPSGTGGHHVPGRGHGEGGHVGEPVFVPDCLGDAFETIDRAEMNKYLLPDQGIPGHYPPPHGHLQPITTMTQMTTMNTMTTGGASSCTAPLTSGSSATLTSLPPLTSRLLPPAAVYGGSASPYYAGGASPHPPSQGSPELSSELGGGGGPGGVSPGGSPGSPAGEYVELQPPRVPKEEPLPPLTPTKPPGVSPFLHQNLCYPTQPYAAFQYSYPYAAMWH